jgi:hypothetical protein
MTDLVLKTFSNGLLATHKSYGDKSLAENIARAEKAIEKVQYTERIWNKSRSQFMLKHLVCSQPDAWMRMRQISAEMASKRLAFVEAKFAYMENLAEAKVKREEAETTEGAKTDLLLIQAAKLETATKEMLTKIEGALKEMETLANMHDSLKEVLGDISELEFEKVQVKAHIKRAVMQATREMRDIGSIKSGNQEYLEQVGVCVTAVKAEIADYLLRESGTEVKNTSLLHSFLTDMAERYAPAAGVQAEILGFQLDPYEDLTFVPEEKQ